MNDSPIITTTMSSGKEVTEDIGEQQRSNENGRQADVQIRSDANQTRIPINQTRMPVNQTRMPVNQTNDFSDDDEYLISDLELLMSQQSL